uniref:Tc1-like transposase DDE domain-containing protein n=1 Tax=Gouania willdenowi TaxID=441366 RepID=A0A8C5GJS9_GOUWI
MFSSGTRTRINQNSLTTNNITVLDWPPYSPDMNLIKHLWDVLG